MTPLLQERRSRRQPELVKSRVLVRPTPQWHWSVACGWSSRKVPSYNGAKGDNQLVIKILIKSSKYKVYSNSSFLESCHFYVFFIWYHPNPLAIPTFSTSLLHSKALKLVQRDVITSFHIFSSELLCQQCSFRSIFRFQNVFMTDKGIGWGWGFGGARSVGLGTRWHGAGSGKRVRNSRETARNATKHNNGASRRLLHQTS